MAFDFIGYFAVPFLTVALSRETALFSTNFSSIRTANHRQGEFLVWSFLLLFYLFFCFLPFFLQEEPPAPQKMGRNVFSLPGLRAPSPDIGIYSLPAEGEAFSLSDSCVRLRLVGCQLLCLSCPDCPPALFLPPEGRKTSALPAHGSSLLLRFLLPDHGDRKQCHGDCLHPCLLCCRQPASPVFFRPQAAESLNGSSFSL